ncbi:MAG: hypothetical protein ABSH16_11600, partial [Sedimentisphaerales bacterium]
MKSLVTILLVLVAVGTANANVTTQTGAIASMTDDSAYAWNINCSPLAAGETIVSAKLEFVNLQDVDYGSLDKFYTNLLDNHVTTTDGWVRAGGDTDPYYWYGTPTGVGDYFDSHNTPNVLVGTYPPTNNHDVSFSYDLVALGLSNTLASYMANGQFAFGFDPDCEWTADNIKFTLTTTSNTVPAP